MSRHWSVHQLTDYLSEISSQRNEEQAIEVAAERAAEALDAEVAAVALGGEMRCCVGFGRTPPPAGLLATGLAGGTFDAPGIGRLQVGAAGLGRGTDDVLVVGRVGDPFAAEERQMLHGMARMLGLAVRGIHTLEAERVLREAVQARHRLVETLLDIQRTISSRRPLQEILDTITAGAAGLFDGWAVSLVLTEPTSADLRVVASTYGRRTSDDAAVRAAPLAPDSVLLTAPVIVAGETIGSLVADLPTGLGAAPERRQLLTAFAQQVGLAIADARTVQAVREAYHDPLTGLANRALFLDLLDDALAEPGLAVVYIDLDGFKAVNDSFGHQAGDELLSLVGARILGCLRASDTAARLGGDEFAILLTEGGQQVAVDVAERIIAALKEPFQVGGREVFIAASAGVAYPQHAHDGAADLLSSGDVAMYQAKQLGRGRVIVFEPAMRVAQRRRQELQAELRRATGFHDFHLGYQPIARLDTGEPVGVEALLRWNHPQHGPISPAEFIPVAEETGVIRDLGRWVLEHSARQVSRWRTTYPGLRLNVNVSARQLGTRRFPEEVADVLHRTRLPGHALTLELTETALMTDPDAVLRQLVELRDLGIQISMDDFGTGYSSLSYLRRFPVDEVKIDRTFVAHVDRSTDDLALVSAVVDLCRTLRLTTVAEGIENDGQLAVLRRLGCRLGQGNRLARPLDAASVSAYLAGRRIAA